MTDAAAAVESEPIPPTPAEQAAALTAELERTRGETDSWRDRAAALEARVASADQAAAAAGQEHRRQVQGLLLQVKQEQRRAATGHAPAMLKLAFRQSRRQRPAHRHSRSRRRERRAQHQQRQRHHQHIPAMLTANAHREITSSSDHCEPSTCS